MELTCPFMDECIYSFSYSKNMELHVPPSRVCQLEVKIMELHGFCEVKVSKTSRNNENHEHLTNSRFLSRNADPYVDVSLRSPHAKELHTT